MAIIKVGPPLSAIRGTVGGITYSANKSGTYARLWSKGSNPKTPFQSTQRSVIAGMPASWRDLSTSNKLAWDTWAELPDQNRINRLGVTFSASGFNWFTIVNTRLANIGRTERTVPPTQTRPSAPTLTSLVLPFRDQQATKVTYPSGEFDPDFDLVLELTVALSTGRTVAPGNFLLLKLDKEPPDQDNEFVAQYLERWNLAGSSPKGFARLYRQTTDGLRSSAGTASFTIGDTAPYAATAKDYDGLNNFGLRTVNFAGNSDSRVCTISLWFRIDGADGTGRDFISSDGIRYRLRLNSDNKFHILLRTSTPTTLLDATTTSTFLAGAAWHNVIWAIDLPSAIVRLAVDGVEESPIIASGPTNGIIKWTRSQHSLAATFAGASKFDGCLTELYFNNAEFLDILDPLNLARFIDVDGFPVDLGATAAFPTNSQPLVYVREGDPETNRGYGGPYVNQAALSACSTDPP